MWTLLKQYTTVNWLTFFISCHLFLHLLSFFASADFCRPYLMTSGDDKAHNNYINASFCHVRKININQLSCFSFKTISFSLVNLLMFCFSFVLFWFSPLFYEHISHVSEHKKTKRLWSGYETKFMILVHITFQFCRFGLKKYWYFDFCKRIWRLIWKRLYCGFPEVKRCCLKIGSSHPSISWMSINTRNYTVLNLLFTYWLQKIKSPALMY